MKLAPSILIFFISRSLGSEDVNNKTSPDVKRMMEDQCRKEYSVTCLKLDLAALMPTLGVSRQLRLLPGLTLEAGGFETKVPGGKLPLETVEPALDRYLVKGLDSFINSIAIRIKVMDKAVSERIHHIGHAFVNDVEGRGRRKKFNALMMGGMVSAGTLLALTMSAISAMAGKAILVSLLSLAMTLMSRGGGGSNAGGGGGGHAKHTYEIYTHPIHDDYNNRHWAQDLAEGSYIVKATPQNR